MEGLLNFNRRWVAKSEAKQMVLGWRDHTSLVVAFLLVKPCYTFTISRRLDVMAGCGVGV